MTILPGMMVRTKSGLVRPISNMEMSRFIHQQRRNLIGVVLRKFFGKPRPDDDFPEMAIQQANSRMGVTRRVILPRYDWRNHE